MSMDIICVPLKHSQRRFPTQLDFYADWRGSSSGTWSIFQGRGITVSHAFKAVQRLTGQFLTRSIGFIRNSRFQRGHRWTRVALAQSLFKLQVAAVSFWPKHRVVHIPPLLKLLRFFDNFSRGACTTENLALLCRQNLRYPRLTWWYENYKSVDRRHRTPRQNVVSVQRPKKKPSTCTVNQ